MKTIKPKLFWILAITEAVFAFAVFYNNNAPPEINYPIGHRFSIPVLLLCFGAIVSCYLMWLFDIKNKRASFLPSPAVVLLLATLTTILSAVLFHPLSSLGWCCENAHAFFFGFPFNYLIGLGNSLLALRLPYESYVWKVLFLSTSQPQDGWQFLPYLLFLDFLFWSNGIFVSLSLVNWFRHEKNLSEPIKEIIQSETV